MSEISRADFAGFAVRELVYPAGRRMQRHAHGYSNVTVVVSGEMEETTDTAEHRGRSCSVLLKPAGTMHANHIPGRQGTRTVSVELRAASALAREVQSLSWQWLEDPDTARAGLSFYRTWRAGVLAEIETSAAALLATVTGAARRAGGIAPSWLTEIRAIPDTRFDEPLRFETLAADFGLHPVYLARAFRKHTGVAMGDYVRSLRLREARHLLTATTRPLAAISAGTGFTDASHLSRVFTQTHGVTPACYRRLCGGG